MGTTYLRYRIKPEKCNWNVGCTWHICRGCAIHDSVLRGFSRVQQGFCIGNVQNKITHSLTSHLLGLVGNWQSYGRFSQPFVTDFRLGMVRVRVRVRVRVTFRVRYNAIYWYQIEGNFISNTFSSVNIFKKVENALAKLKKNIWFFKKICVVNVGKWP